MRHGEVHYEQRCGDARGSDSLLVAPGCILFSLSLADGLIAHIPPQSNVSLSSGHPDKQI